MITTDTLTEVIQSMGFEIESKHIDRRPDGLMSDFGFGSTHWDVTVRFFRDENDDDGSSMQVLYSMGSALSGPPKLMDVIASVVMDSSVSDQFNSVQEFAREFGYENLKQARKVYQSCQKTRANLLRIVGKENFDRLLSAENDW
jgi:hypothetical protein